MTIEERRPRRGFLAAFVGRPLLFVLWSLVLWGTLLGLASLVALLTREAEAPSPLAGGGWAWLNLASVVLAVLGWGAVALALRGRRRP